MKIYLCFVCCFAVYYANCNYWDILIEEQRIKLQKLQLEQKRKDVANTQFDDDISCTISGGHCDGDDLGSGEQHDDEDVEDGGSAGGFINVFVSSGEDSQLAYGSGASGSHFPVDDMRFDGDFDFPISGMF